VDKANVYSIWVTQGGIGQSQEIADSRVSRIGKSISFKEEVDK